MSSREILLARLVARVALPLERVIFVPAVLAVFADTGSVSEARMLGILFDCDELRDYFVAVVNAAALTPRGREEIQLFHSRN